MKRSLLKVYAQAFLAMMTCCFTNAADPKQPQPGTSPSVPVVEWPEPKNSASVVWFQAVNDLYGLRDANGKEVLSPRFNDVKPFSEGLAAVNIGAIWEFPGYMTGGRWGYINEAGELTISIQYTDAASFSNGRAQVSHWKLGSGAHFIDQSGEVRISLPEASYAGEFREGLAPIHPHTERTQGTPRTEYINRMGKIRFTIHGWGEEFHNGLAAFSVPRGPAVSNSNRSYGYIDKTGKVVIKPQFAEAHQFSEGLAAVRTKKTTVYGMGDTWGYIDRTGKYVIDPIYNEARAFQSGQALVHEGGILAEVLDAPPFWEGGTWWLIDKTGKKVGRISE